MNLLSIDFEEWYHPELIKPYISNKEKKPSVINGIDKILELLRKHETFATFFVVGELLEIKPTLLDKIVDAGHEIACHTMHHNRLDTVGYEKMFGEEIKKFDRLTSSKSKGFRAPTFSLNKSTAWAIDILSTNGYVYDSSVVPAKTSMYGMPNAETKPYKISSSSIERNDPNAKLIEFPLLVTRFLRKKIPAGGGFYLRTLPLKIIKKAIESYEKNDIPACFYVHSWELTPEFMPKVSLPKKEYFITYHNIEKVFLRVEAIIKEFKFTSFYSYINKNKHMIN
jgi:polysaccharide deacetylase family protein (PEP-CTERM system associated)